MANLLAFIRKRETAIRDNIAQLTTKLIELTGGKDDDKEDAE